MKKIIILALVFCFITHTYQAMETENCTKELTIENLNSKNLLAYIKEKDLLGKVSQICSQDFCKTISWNNVEHDVKEFIKQNVNYIKSKSEELGISADLKGFRIEKIITRDC